MESGVSKQKHGTRDTLEALRMSLEEEACLNINRELPISEQEARTRSNLHLLRAWRLP
jgi:hypothetical protein